MVSQNQQPGIPSGADPAQIFRDGQEALNANRLTEAERDFRAIIAADPQVGGAYANLAVVYMRRKQWTSALSMLHKAEKLLPGVAGISLNIGLVYFRQNEFLKAIPPLESAVRGEPDALQPRHLLGLCYFFTERWADAANTLEPLWQQESGQLSYLYVLSIASHRAGMKDLDEKATAQLIKTGDGSPEFHLFMGKAHLNLEQYDLALADFQAAAQANPKLTFDQFVIGDCNRLAHAAALTVAEMPAQAYNPLFICGPPGVGKTHLLSSIANLLLSHNPGLTVRCTTGEAFTNEFLAALASGHTEAFKLRFRDVDVLLLDDVQFLERKTKTEEEFFHTFNALQDGGRQLVLSSDRPPHDLQALEDRLRERFEAGLVADIKPPELATRLAILRKRVQHDHIELDDPRALNAIAEHIHSNVRALEGALIRVVAFSSLTG